MKVKLLKKLRKRFHWFRHSGHTCWTYYDNKHNHTRYAFECRFYYVNDMLMYKLLQDAGLSHLFRSLANRKDARILARHKKKMKEEYGTNF
jgi:hypothetical protein